MKDVSQLERQVQRYISRLQGVVRKIVTDYLKMEEPQSLKFVRVGISPLPDGTYKLSIKIYHSKPLKLESINEIVRRLRRYVNVSEWRICAPHAGAIRIEAQLSIDLLQELLTSSGVVR